MSGELADAMLEALEHDLRQAVAHLPAGRTAALREMLDYHLGWSSGTPAGRGKRIRPQLTLLACQAAGGDWTTALPAASAVELIHNFSLVHDDIQDQSNARRGRPTLWTLWGVPQAINAGDALLVLARLATQRLLARGVSAADALEVQRLLDQACLELTQGQFLDLDFETRPAVPVADYLAMIEGKTAALLAAATACGAHLAGAGAARVQAFADYGRSLGLAFQILDDILGIWGATQDTGKPAGDDLRARKKSLPIVWGIENAPAFADLWQAGAVDDQSVGAMAGALEAEGALPAARAAAADYTARALEALAHAAVEPGAGAALRALTLQLLHRDR